MIRILQYTSYNTPLEYIDNTTRLERVYLAEAVKEFEQEEQKTRNKILQALFGG